MLQISQLMSAGARLQVHLPGQLGAHALALCSSVSVHGMCRSVVSFVVSQAATFRVVPWILRAKIKQYNQQVFHRHLCFYNARVCHQLTRQLLLEPRVMCELSQVGR